MTDCPTCNRPCPQPWRVRKDRTGRWQAHPWHTIHPDGRTRWWNRTWEEAQHTADVEARK